MNYLRSSSGTSRFGYYKKGLALFGVLLLVLLRGPIANITFPLLAGLASPFWHLRALFVPDRQVDEKDEMIKILEGRIGQILKEDILDRTRLTHVLSSLSVSPYGTILVDRGLKSGMQLGDHLISLGGISLGEVIEVFDDSSKVSLHSVFGKNIEVSLENGERFIVVGAGNQNFEARLPSGMSLNSGQFLYLPGAEHYVIAKVEKIESLPGAAFQKVFARSPVNIHSISTLYVGN